MAMKMKPAAAALALALTMPAAGWSQDVEAGEEIFQFRCAVCHGEGGKGDGIVGELFAQKPSDLTHLTKENGGTFPFMQVLTAIDGSERIAGHGTTEMPVWGEFFMTEALEDRGIDPKDAAQVVRGRMLSLVLYIRSLQES